MSPSTHPRGSGLRRSGRLLVLALTIGLAAATAWRPASAEAQLDLEAFDREAEAARQAFEVPGMAIAIVKDGQTVFARGYGVRHHEEGGAVGEHTLFAIASNTKAFTAAALAMLVDEDRLDWDDPVRDYLPWLELYAPYVSADLRIRDLLSHRSGLGTYSGDLVWYGTDYTPEEVIRRIRHLEPTGPFRARYAYSNVMFITAGLVIEEISGRTWSEFIRQRILQPLGMRRTVTTTEALETLDDVAVPHGTWRGEQTAFPWYNWDGMAAAGGIISSVTDMARWIRLQLGRGGVDGLRLFGEEQSRQMWQAHTPIPVSRGSEERFPSTHFKAYGLGWSLMDYRGRKVVQHGGGYDGMFSRVVLVPEEELGFVILTNDMTPVQTALAYRILDGWLGADPEDWTARYLEDHRRSRARREEQAEALLALRDPARPPSREPGAYAGSYAGPLYGEVRVEQGPDGLVLRMLPNPDLVADLTHLHDDVYVIDWRRPFPWFDRGTAQFLLDREGAVEQLRLFVPNEDFWFQELELHRTAPRGDGEPPERD